tara:strand:- start:2365 stop:2613 length:249 start_codon:yes stop_codon:yes gene_type:complete
MERILKKLTEKEMQKRDKQCEYDLAKEPCPLCSQKEINLGYETLKSLTKSDLIKIIQAKNDLLVQYVDWVNELKSEKERESK